MRVTEREHTSHANVNYKLLLYNRLFVSLETRVSRRKFLSPLLAHNARVAHGVALIIIQSKVHYVETTTINFDH